ncbi:hypothetical protein J8273_6898 [Carpediemonas membranifera]|uniref:Uncharacterized protein n=1 Tax=Carpediemonas membranifera TaxID=201153 RepID=A0A8J6AUF0_9EUKA|nr:hypothetical protein J8273_6898 [Carpediemonas membranifera]|eukprot:KAG9391830.1 hypothetical protein J8273_6898 [Carpediemonas membranifera]
MDLLDDFNSYCGPIDDGEELNFELPLSELPSLFPIESLARPSVATADSPADDAWEQFLHYTDQAIALFGDGFTGVAPGMLIQHLQSNWPSLETYGESAATTLVDQAIMNGIVQVDSTNGNLRPYSHGPLVSSPLDNAAAWRGTLHGCPDIVDLLDFPPGMEQTRAVLKDPWVFPDPVAQTITVTPSLPPPSPVKGPTPDPPRMPVEATAPVVELSEAPGAAPMSPELVAVLLMAAGLGALLSGGHGLVAGAVAGVLALLCWRG